MITLVEALNYRCLRYIRQPLDPFHVLVGPNASGKTTFLDVIAFLGRLVSDGPNAAVEERTQNFYDLVWLREGDRFELAIEARIPDHFRERLTHKHLDTVRYDVAVGLDPKTRELGLQREHVVLKAAQPYASGSADSQEDELGVIIKGNFDAFFSETPQEPDKIWNISFNVGPQRSAFGSLPPDESMFPVSLWLKDLLSSGLQNLTLNNLSLRQASPPGRRARFQTDGSGLPWIVADLRQQAPERFRLWISHLQTAFPDLQDIEVIERPDDRHRYLMLVYGNGLKVPSWMASEGTLRMLALTLPAYLADFKGIYLVEEPENGIHPTAIETMTQSLSSVYDAQVLMATHSPIVLSTVEPEQVLCFSKDAEGATEIVRGSEHPALQQWKRETSLGTLFASGVLG